MSKSIGLHEPYLGKYEIKYLEDCINTGWIVNGKYIEKFANSIKKITNSKYVILCSNGTAALHLSLILMDIGFNDEVIVPTTTFVASINAIKYVGANPIFMDVDDSFNIDAKKTLFFLENNTYYKGKHTYNKKNNLKIKGIMLVHVFGNAADIESIYFFCKKNNIKIIEDAAESLGTKYISGKFKGKHTGTIGDIGCISFNSNKIITSAGGGAILTNNKSVSARANYLINQAKDDVIKFIHNEIGFNYRMSNIHAAIGFAQINRFKEIYLKKLEIKNFYKKYFKDSDNINLVQGHFFSNNNNWINVIRLDGFKYKKIIKLTEYLKKNKIDVRPVWYLNHLQKPFLKCENYKIKNAIKLNNESLCLPSGPGLSELKIKKICKFIKEFYLKTL